MSSQPINGGRFWCAVRSIELLIGDVTFPVPSHLEVYVSIVTMLTRNDTWPKQMKKAAKHLVKTKGVLDLSLWRNLEVPQDESPSIYNIKLQYGDWRFSHFGANIGKWWRKVWGCQDTWG